MQTFIMYCWQCEIFIKYINSEESAFKYSKQDLERISLCLTPPILLEIMDSTPKTSSQERNGL
jgi:hypothetical protein